MSSTFDLFSLKKSDVSCLQKNGHLFQSAFWAEFKSLWGWRTEAFILEFKERTYPVLMLTKSLALGYDFGYIPYGPCLEQNDAEILALVGREMARLSSRKLLFIRFDLSWITTRGEQPAQRLKIRGLRKSLMDVQPVSTIEIDLEASEEELLGAMKSKWRYNIRLAQKKKVVIRQEDISFLPTWYGLYEETGKRDKIALHSFEYYRSLLSLGKETDAGSPEFYIFSAYHEDELLAGIIVAHYAKQAVYLYGASSNYKRNFMPNYILQWEAIKQAKSRGCKSYDFFGIPPKADPSHPMYGLYRFKTGFGGEIQHRPGCYDLVLSSLFYRGYLWAEAIRLFYFKVLKKCF